MKCGAIALWAPWVAVLLCQHSLLAAAFCPSNAIPASGATLSGDSGSITLMPYSNNNDCKWTIECPSGTVVRVTNLTLDTEAGFDILTLDCTSHSGSKVAGVATNATVLPVHFRSDPSVVKRGFRLEYSCVRILGCGMVNGTLQNCTQPFQCPGAAPPSTSGSRPQYVEVRPTTCQTTETALSFSVNGSFNDPLSIASTSLSSLDASGSVLSYIGAAQPSGTSGFLMEYRCLGSPCDSVNTTWELTAPSGTLISDTDGFGPLAIRSDDSCLWSVRCPKATDSMMLRLWIDVSSSSSLYVFGATGAVLSKYDGYFIQASPTEVPESSIHVAFVANPPPYSVTPLPQSGFTLQYECINWQCSSVNGSGTNYSNVLDGTILSDTDGFGPGPYLPYEKCEWTVVCPAGRSFFIRGVQHNFDLATTLRVIDLTTGLEQVVFAGTEVRPISYLFNMSAARLRFRSERYSSSTGTGFTLAFACIPSERQPDEWHPEVFTTTFLLPPACGAGQVGHLHVLDEELPPGNCGFNANGTRIWNYGYRTTYEGAITSSTNLTFEFSAAVGSQPVLYVAFLSCTGTCLSPNASSEFTAASGVLLLSAPANASRSGEYCSWLVFCPAGRRVMLILSPSTVTGYLRVLYPVLYQGTQIDFLDFQPSATYFSTSATTMTLEYVSMPGTPSVDATVQWVCLSYWCSSINDTEVTYHSASGRLVSGVLGPVTAWSDHCSWSVHCPNGTWFSIALLNITGRFGDVTLSVVDELTWTTVAEFNPSLAMQGLLTNSSRVQIGWDGSGYSSSGFTLDWQCVPYSCGPDGSCAATVSCPNPATDVLYPTTGTQEPPSTAQLPQTVVATAVTRGALIHFLASEPAITAAYTGPTPMSPAVANGSAAVVSFASPLGHTTTSAVAYRCQPSGQCGGSAPSGSFFSGSSGSVGGAPIPNATTAESCFYVVNCPPGYSALMDAEVSIAGPTGLQLSNSKCNIGTLGWSADASAVLSDLPFFIAYNALGRYNVSWLCMSGRCPSSTEDNTTLTSDGGAITGERIQAGEQCSWNIQCPTGTRVVFRSFHGFENGLRASVFDLASQWAVDSDSIGVDTHDLVCPSNTVRVELSRPLHAGSGIFTDWYSYSVHYECEDAQSHLPPFVAVIIGVIVVALAVALAMYLIRRRRRTKFAQLERRIVEDASDAVREELSWNVSPDDPNRGLQKSLPDIPGDSLVSHEADRFASPPLHGYGTTGP